MCSPVIRSGRSGMKRLRSAGDRAVKTTVEQNSDARIGYRISVCSSGAASICQRASMKVIGHTIRTRFPTEALPPALRKADVIPSCFNPPR